MDQKEEYIVTVAKMRNHQYKVTMVYRTVNQEQKVIKIKGGSVALLGLIINHLM